MTLKLIKFAYLSICWFSVNAAGNALAQSPYEISWKKDGVLAGSGLAALTVGFVVSSEVTPLTEEEIQALSPDDVNAFDRPATNNYSESADHASDVAVWTCLALPATALFSSRMRDDVGTIALMYAETMLLSNGITQIVKGTMTRTRPFVYNPAAPPAQKTDPDARKSFYSSHTANAFAAAAFFATVYGDYFPDSKWEPYVWAGSMLAAASAGYFRVEAGRHFPSDVLVGAGVGLAIGLLVPHWHRRGEQQLNLAPSHRLGQVQMEVRYVF